MTFHLNLSSCTAKLRGSDRHVITLKGWGGCHKQGGNCGDLLIEILVEGDDDYEKV